MNAHQIIEKLEKRQLEAQIKVEEIKSVHEKRLYSEIENLKAALEGRDEEIHNLRIANKSSKEVSKKLRLAMCESKDKFEKEKVQLVKDHKAEVKAWKRDLGEANSKVIKLEKLANKYEACSPNSTHTSGDSPTSLPSIVSETQPLKTQPIKSEIQCSICSVTIADYKPKYFLGEAFNPACDDCNDSFEGDDSGPDPNGCEHTPVCVTRQPHPPPYPSITHIVNENSKYHEHMMSRAGVPGRYPGHERCMSAYSNNYGCEDCVWLKWHGELHGYPDIHPNVKHLFLIKKKQRTSRA